MADQPYKPILCLDFDGVIHRYSKGWQDGSIYDDVTEGFFDWAEKAKEYFKLVIYSSRSKTDEGVMQMSLWLQKQRSAWANKSGVTTITEFEFAHEKPPAFLTIDDRALCFSGTWAIFDPQILRGFKPWMDTSG
jgi:hypothetical protein